GAVAHVVGDRPGTGVLVGLASALAFGASGPVVKPLLEAGWSPGAAVLARALCSALVLAPLAAVALRGSHGLLRAEWRLVLGFGLVAVAGTQLCYFAAVARMPVGVALLVEYLAPVLLVGLAWARTRRVPPRLTLAGCVVAVAGLRPPGPRRRPAGPRRGRGRGHLLRALGPPDAPAARRPRRRRAGRGRGGARRRGTRGPATPRRAVRRGGPPRLVRPVVRPPR